VYVYSVYVCSMSDCGFSYDEDVVVMLARLETLLYFDTTDSAAAKMRRLGFMTLPKLAVLAQNVSLLLQCRLGRLYSRSIN